MRDRARDDAYLIGLFWVIRHRAGAGGWPPNDVEKVSGWTVVKLLAAIGQRNVRDVAQDVIDNAAVMESRDDAY